MLWLGIQLRCTVVNTPGNNKISSLENLMYLRQFKSLDVANFDGNPVCAESDYRSMVYAFMPWLKYLDYVLIDESKRVEARETHQVRPCCGWACRSHVAAMLTLYTTIACSTCCLTWRKRSATSSWAR